MLAINDKTSTRVRPMPWINKPVEMISDLSLSELELFSIKKRKTPEFISNVANGITKVHKEIKKSIKP